MVRVLICDDQAIVREGLAAILGTVANFEVVGLAQNGREAVAMVGEFRPNIVLMDLNMPKMNGVKATQHIRATHPHIPVLILTTYADEKWVRDAIDAGAAGYLLKDTRRDDLIRAIEGTINDEAYLDPRIANVLLRRVKREPTPTHYDLTDREIDVLRLLAQGMTNREIGEALFLSAGTVRNYVSNMLSKLGVSDRTQAAVIAARIGLLD